MATIIDAKPTRNIPDPISNQRILASPQYTDRPQQAQSMFRSTRFSLYLRYFSPVRRP